MTEQENSLLHIPYADIVAFFKAHPAIWFVIQRMMEDAGDS